MNVISDKNKMLLNCLIKHCITNYHSKSNLRLFSSTCVRKIEPKYHNSSKIHCEVCGKYFLHRTQLTIHYSFCHEKPLLDYLSNNSDRIINIYESVYGKQHTQINDNYIEFPNEIQVAINGCESGLWKSKNDDTTNSIIDAISKEFGLPYFKSFVACMDLLKLEPDQIGKLKNEYFYNVSKLSPNQEADVSSDDKKYRQFLTAKNIWEASEELSGSIAEKYLVEHRKIPKEFIKNLDMRYLPSHKPYFHELWGMEMSRANPSLVTRCENENSEVTGIQRIFLNPETGNKVDTYRLPKKSKGIIMGSAGIIQKGTNNDIVYLVEGPETGASVASAVGPDKYVLASLGITHLSGLICYILKIKPRSVIWAIDRDVPAKSWFNAGAMFKRLKNGLKLENISIDILSPSLKNEKEIFAFQDKYNVDFNDVLKVHGIEEVRKQLNVK